jgi:sigma-B regulation protein RsbU (phosphoserine phosphatase)
MLTQPGEMLGALNRELTEQNLGKHATMFIGVVDVGRDTLHYANAGHFPHAIHAGQHGGPHATYLEAPGKPVGLFDDVHYEPASIKLEPGDSVVTFSDGVLELMHDDGLPAKEARLVECSGKAAPDIDALWEGLGIAPDSPGPDDVTCLVVQRTS